MPSCNTSSRSSFGQLHGRAKILQHLLAQALDIRRLPHEKVLLRRGLAVISPYVFQPQRRWQACKPLVPPSLALPM